MRPHKIFNCVLWLLLFGIGFHIIFFVLFPLFSYDSNGDSDYLSISRDVKEFKVDHFSMKQSLLSKLRFHVFDIINFRPDHKNGPLPLKRLKPKFNQLNNSFNEKFNHSLFSYSVESMNETDLFRLLLRINEEQDIINIDYFPNPEFVIVIQIHNRLEYLTILIDSLLNVKDIHRTLLVFSHDIYSSEFNYIIRSIRFAPVIQVFFPFNNQIFKSQYPGYSKKDCSVKLKKNLAISQNCFNANWSDTYQHYRDYKYTQTKHHWVWKANFVFERIRMLRDFKNPIVFMEEDHYLVEDFIHVLRLMMKEKQKKFPNVSILSLGTYEKSHAFNPSSKVQVGVWVSSFHNMGMAFNRTVWRRIKTCAKDFCNFDDYNWDWSLQHVNKKCLENNFQVMMLKFAPRIFHIGECGIHHKKDICNPYIVLHKIRRLLIQNMQYLYPTTIIHIGSTNIRSKNMKPNGGWSDQRDQKLCLLLMNGSENLENVTSTYLSLSHPHSLPLTNPHNDNHLTVLESLLLTTLN